MLSMNTISKVVYALGLAAGLFLGLSWFAERLEPEANGTILPICLDSIDDLDEALTAIISDDRKKMEELAQTCNEPNNGLEQQLVTVLPGTIGVITSGPICIEDECLPGGINRGSVTILMPKMGEPMTYAVEVLPYSNWYGSYAVSEIDEAAALQVAAKHVELMKLSPNCTDGKGCDLIDIAIAGLKQHAFRLSEEQLKSRILNSPPNFGDN